jgi:serine/threonine protein kinase
MTLPSGTKLGPYEIQSLLGAGGMGEVYRARDTRFERDVAIRILPNTLTHDQDRLRRFEQEARDVAALTHPNLLTVFDVGTVPLADAHAANATEASPFIVPSLANGLNVTVSRDFSRFTSRRGLFIFCCYWR